MFRKILIANRGEIACRIAHTARRLGIRTVAVYSDVDRDAAHVQYCDEAVAIGGDSPATSYLRQEAILEAARRTGAEAIHPGYGFLSENAGFAQACVDQGLVFIGPPPSAIAAMGSKAEAKALMERAGVPLVPGYHGRDNSPAVLRAEAERIGVPLLIKASAGGGGRGMRRVDHLDDFDAALQSCQREARTAFGDDHVLIERYVTRPRHIEIQVFADSLGHVVHLFERDCSVQRRHQKVLEESPAPGLHPDRRAAMGAAAVEAARAVGYVGAGTVEFIAEPTDDGDLRFYFMEMNTRLQVEHPVTEAVTGQDLVEWQLRVAAGAPLPLTQDQLVLKGHAIEARLCAENPEAGFLPATGRLDVAQWPDGHAGFARNADNHPSHPAAPVRIDTGVREGDTVSPHYDSMLAKLIVWGEDREQALARMETAVEQTCLAGLATNVDFLRRLIRTPSFRKPDLDTALIEREGERLLPHTPVSPSFAAIAGAVLCVLQDPGAQSLADDTGTWKPPQQEARWTDPWGRTDGFRVHGTARRHFLFRHKDKNLQVVTWQDTQGAFQLSLSGEAPKHIEWRSALSDSGSPANHPAQPQQGTRWRIGIDKEEHTVTTYRRGLRFILDTGGHIATFEILDPLAPDGGDHSHTEGQLTAPMPGRLIAWKVQAGETVKAGQLLAVMEAMKMEHSLTAPHDGRVDALLYAVGDQIREEGAPLLQMTAEA